MTKMSLISAIAAISILLTGCAGAPSVKLDQAIKNSVKTVTVRKDVPLPADMFYQGKAQSIGMGLGGAVGYAIAQGATSDKEIIQQILQKNNINVGEIVADTFTSQLRSSGKFSLSEGSVPEDAQFQFEVVMFGLGQTQGFANALYPTLGVNGLLKSKDGKVLWQKYEYVTPLNKENTIGAEPSAYVKDPELLRQAFTKAATALTALFIKSL
jgi:hypothetical protein